MKYLKMLSLAGVAAMAMMALTAGPASATTLALGGVAQNKSIAITATLEAGTSAVLKETAGGFVDTCTTSEVKGATEFDRVSPAEAPTKGFTGNEVGGEVTTLTFDNCTHETLVDAKGTLWVKHITGTTNGTVTSNGAEVTVQSTTFGITLNCKTGSGTDIGTITGVKAGKATMDINAVVNCGFIPSAKWEGSYLVTTPETLGLEP